MKNKKIDISIVVPVYNEEDSIQPLFIDITKNINTKYNWELIFINDGSNDKTKENILSLLEKNSHIKLINSENNNGKSEALYQGFQYSSGKIVITMDGDLQDDPTEINNFVKKINDGNDMVSGWKKKRLDPMSKRLPSKIFNFCLRFISKIKINDFNCGFKAYKNHVAKSIVIYGGLHRFIPILIKKNGYKISEIVVNHKQRKYGKSKYGNSRLFHGFFDLITVLFLNKYFNRPLHLFGMLGIVLSSTGLFINLYLTINWFNGIWITPYKNPLFFLGLLLLIIGVQFFSIGLIGELFVRYYKKENNNTYSYYNLIK